MWYRLTADLLRPGGHLAFWSAPHVVPVWGAKTLPWL